MSDSDFIQLERIDNEGLEKLFGDRKPFADAKKWLAQGNEVSDRVCAIRVNDIPRGTGFLVAPDLVMTAYHVVKDIVQKKVPIAQLRFIFDHVGSTPEIAFDSHSEPCEVFSPESELDFAIIRLAENPQRGWLDLPRDPYEFSHRVGLAIIQHPQGEPQRLALGPDQPEFVGDGVHLKYTVPTNGGSSGSPVLVTNDDWAIVALHKGYTSDRNRGVIMSLIASRDDVLVTLLEPFKRASRAPIPLPKPVYRTRWWVVVGYCAVVAAVSIGAMRAFGPAAQVAPEPTTPIDVAFVGDAADAVRLSGTAALRVGGREYGVTMQNASSATFVVPRTSRGLPFSVVLPDEYRVATQPTILPGEGPVEIRVEHRDTCKDARFLVRVSAAKTEKSTHADKMKLTLDLRIVSQTQWPFTIDPEFSLEVRPANDASSFYKSHSPDRATVSAQSASDRSRDVVISRADYARIAAGARVVVSLRCKDLDRPTDIGALVSSDPTDLDLPALAPSGVQPSTFVCDYLTPVVHAKATKSITAVDRAAATRTCAAFCASQAGDSCTLE